MMAIQIGTILFCLVLCLGLLAAAGKVSRVDAGPSALKSTTRAPEPH